MISSFEKSLRASGILASDISIIKEIMMLGFLIPVNSVVFIPNDGLVAFHYSSYGTFCVHLKSSINLQWFYPLQKLDSLSTVVG